MGFHIVKRENCPLWKQAIFYLIAIAAALLLGAVILIVIDADPVEYYFRMFTMGTVDNPIAGTFFMSYLQEFVPLVMTALGLSLAFRMRFWNIGGEGQFIMGAIAASAVAILLGETLPSWAVLLIMCLAAMLVAGLYGLLVAALKVRFDTNETLLTLMLNYIAIYVLKFLIETKASWNFFLDPEALRPLPKDHPEGAMFPTIPIVGRFELNVCVIFAFIIGVIVYLYLKKTKHGYEISVVGDSAGTARYAGMKVNKIVLRTVFLSACMIGLASAFKMGSVGKLSDTITNDVGWTGIIVAWLAKLNPIAIFVISALMCVLHFGSEKAMSVFGQVDSSFADMLQGLILFFVLAADFMIRFKIVRTRKEG